jgi:3-oxoacyl-[acyl-carrier protein] reductase
MVTGAGRGIGRAIACKLAARGAAVALLARTRSELEETKRLIEAADERARVLALPADVRELAAIDAAVAHVEAELGPISLLVNAAGTGAAVGPLWEVDADLWWRDVEIVLRGVQLCSRAVLPAMLARGHGRIVNVTSRSGTMATPYHSAYACSRAALLNLTETLAAEVADLGVRIFALTPGIVRTALVEHLLESEEGKRWLPSLAELVADGSAWVEPETVGDAVAVLASGAGDALSGRCVHARDDVEALAARAGEIEAREFNVLRMRLAR